MHTGYTKIIKYKIETVHRNQMGYEVRACFYTKQEDQVLPHVSLNFFFPTSLWLEGNLPKFEQRKYPNITVFVVNPETIFNMWKENFLITPKTSENITWNGKGYYGRQNLIFQGLNDMPHKGKINNSFNQQKKGKKWSPKQLWQNCHILRNS